MKRLNCPGSDPVFATRWREDEAPTEYEPEHDEESETIPAPTPARTAASVAILLTVEAVVALAFYLPTHGWTL